MKKFYFFIGFFFTVTMAMGQLLTENFDYADGQLISANGWTAHSGSGTNAITVTAPGLTYTGHPGSGVGNAVSMTVSGEDDNKGFTAISSGTAYFSFLVNLSAVQTGDYFIGFFQSTSVFPVRIYAKSDGAGGFNLGMSKGNGTVAYETTSRSFGTTYFVVANYIFNTGTTTDDELNLWVNPALGGTETTPTIANVTAASVTDATSIIAIYLRQGGASSASTQQVDAILVGTDWASVTPAAAGTPSLTAGTLSDFGNITAGTNSTSQSFTLSGANLTGAPGNITVTAPSADFEVSADNTAWGSSAVIAYASATLAATNVYVRFTPQSAGAKSGDISISGGGAATTVAVSGTGEAAGGPPPAPVAIAAGAVSGTGFTANWNAAGGATGYFLDVYTLTTGTVTETIAAWNFATNTVANQTADAGNANNTGIQTIAPSGVGTVSWPAGPSGTSGTPNPYSVSANGWDNGADTKYWQVDVNTTGASNITVSSLQGGSNTGPKEFKLQYKVGAAGTWTDVAGGTVTLTMAVSPGNLTTWGAITDLPLPADAGNQSQVSIRWLQTTNTSINNGTVASGGTSRISGIYIKGDVSGGSTPVYVPGYQDLAVGNVTSYPVTGLSLNTTYYYVVRANNASGTSASSNEISVTTTAVAPPAINTTALTAFGTTCIGSTAGPNSFTITGTNLTNADIVVGPLPGYTFSTTSGGTYTNSLTITQSGGAFSQEVFVLFNPIAVQSYDGDIIVNGGGIAAAVNVAVSGSGVNTVPSLIPGLASAITQVAATVGGTITDNGCSAVTAYGIEYSTTPGFANGAGIPVAATNLVAGDFSSGLSGLSPGITYYYHAYATNSGGTGYSTELSFTTATFSPTIVTTALTAFGDVCINTTPAAGSFTITGTNLTTADVTVGPLPGYSFATIAGGPFTASLLMTQPGGSFSQQVFVAFTPVAVQSYNGDIPVNGGGISAAVTVAASGAGVNTAPAVTSGAASGITTVAATLAGNITANGCSAVSAYGIEYSATNGFANGSGTPVASSNLSGGNFTSAVSGLAPSTTYYYHAYATNAGGTSYGVQQSFTTASPVINVTALPAFGNVCVNTVSEPNSFTISSTGLAAGNITVGALSGYSYSTTAAGTYTTTLSIAQAGGPFSQVVFVKLTPAAVQAYAGNITVSGGGAAAVNVVASGSGVNTTPSVVTVGSSDATTSGISLAGSISANGCAAVTAAGFEYSGINNFTPGSGTKVPVTLGATFSASVAGLVQGTTYYFRAYATNAGGTAYGDQQSFTLATIQPGFVLYPVPVQRGHQLTFSMADLTPGYYGLLFINSSGQVAYQKDIHIQAGFINQLMTVPASLSKGVYRVRLVSSTGIVATKSLLIF